jgi:hypothetical protein
VVRQMDRRMEACISDAAGLLLPSYTAIQLDGDASTQSLPDQMLRSANAGNCCRQPMGPGTSLLDLCREREEGFLLCEARDNLHADR